MAASRDNPMHLPFRGDPIAAALVTLRPGSEYVIRGAVYSGIEWDDKNKDSIPTEAEIDDEIVRLQAVFDANKFQRDRAEEYPALKEQFDLLWHAIDDDALDKTSDFYTQLKAIKDAHPKP